MARSNKEHTHDAKQDGNYFERIISIGKDIVSVIDGDCDLVTCILIPGYTVVHTASQDIVGEEYDNWSTHQHYNHAITLSWKTRSLIDGGPQSISSHIHRDTSLDFAIWSCNAMQEAISILKLIYRYSIKLLNIRYNIYISSILL